MCCTTHVPHGAALCTLCPQDASAATISSFLLHLSPNMSLNGSNLSLATRTGAPLGVLSRSAAGRSDRSSRRKRRRRGAATTGPSSDELRGFAALLTRSCDLPRRAVREDLSATLLGVPGSSITS
ncbi:hypothetical protein D4764_06G0012960 [Takifugu flavidus]|uniref:Uncharacterized protein n=1 Tax=Takifugu flavidus TaxID=433684 RepID=A0A5C6MXE2_9TELE|nr:hypothetical protein D4764_06G0012960 [Takifugu flavidus]